MVGLLGFPFALAERWGRCCRFHHCTLLEMLQTRVHIRIWRADSTSRISSRAISFAPIAYIGLAAGRLISGEAL